MNEKQYELVSYGPENKTEDLLHLSEVLIARFGLSEKEAENLISGEYRLYPLFRDQALHLARELNGLGIRTEIHKKTESRSSDE